MAKKHFPKMQYIVLLRCNPAQQTSQPSLNHISEFLSALIPERTLHNVTFSNLHSSVVFAASPLVTQSDKELEPT